jgi:putative Mg2+ transporter-C (MgtC) family protein
MISFWVVLLRLGVALLLGALIGFERESHEHPAGMRTDALVSLGSAFFTIISAYAFLSFLGLPHLQVDPTRIASYVVAGIGFMGAGSIILNRENNQIRGLTTAAATWFVSAIGMACGIGLLLEATMATVLGLIILIFLRMIERRLLPSRFSTTQNLRIEATSMEGQLIGQVCDTLTHAGIVPGTLELHTEQGAGTLVVSCHIPDSTVGKVLGDIRALPGVQAVHLNLHDINAESPTRNTHKEP